jgi:hypothetical protein
MLQRWHCGAMAHWLGAPSRTSGASEGPVVRSSVSVLEARGSVLACLYLLMPAWEAGLWRRHLILPSCTE